MKKGYWSAIAIQLLLLVACCAFGDTNGTRTASPPRHVQVEFLRGSKSVSIVVDGHAFKENLNGYAASDLTSIEPFVNENSTVVFLDIQGVSVGGDLRVFTIENGNPKEIVNDYSGNKITVEIISKEKYVVLWQHDTKNLYYVSNLLVVQNGKLHNISKTDVWKAIINNEYMPHLQEQRDNFTASRYMFYIGEVYKKIGEASLAKSYLVRAGNLDPNNKQIERSIEQLSHSTH